MKNKYLQFFLKTIISIIIYYFLFYFLMQLLQINDFIFIVGTRINNLLLKAPDYITALDNFITLLPAAYLIDSLLCLLVFFVLSKVFPKEIIKNYIVKVSILFFILFLFNYFKSFYDNKKIYESYHKVEQIQEKN